MGPGDDGSPPWKLTGETGDGHDGAASASTPGDGHDGAASASTPGDGHDGAASASTPVPSTPKGGVSIDWARTARLAQIPDWVAPSTPTRLAPQEAVCGPSFLESLDWSPWDVDPAAEPYSEPTADPLRSAPAVPVAVAQPPPFRVAPSELVEQLRTACPASDSASTPVLFKAPPAMEPAQPRVQQTQAPPKAPPPGLAAAAAASPHTAAQPSPPPPPGLAPRSSPSASTPGDEAARVAANTLLMQQDIPVLRSGYSTKRANAWLKELRTECAYRGREAIDLSDDPQWREYIASHPKAREIIGQGIVQFEARFLNCVDPNRESLNLPPPFGEQRFDFIAVRGDGTACRLHPSRSNDAIPTEGRLAWWTLTPLAPTASTPGPGPSASTPGADVDVHIHRPAGVVAENYSRVDIVSSERALRDLLDMVHALRDGGMRDADIRLDLFPGASTPGGWPWHRFLMGRPWGVDLFHEG